MVTFLAEVTESKPIKYLFIDIARKHSYKIHLKTRNLPITFPLPADASAKAIKRFCI